MPRLRHFDNSGSARYVTLTCYRRHRYLTTLVACRILLEGLVHLRRHQEVKILGYVLMPEHVHLVLHPTVGLKLGKPIGHFKSWTARQILNAPEFDRLTPRRNDGRRALWERRHRAIGL